MTEKDIDPKLLEELLKRWDPDKMARFEALRRGKGSRLDASTRAKFEGRFGVDLGNVRILTGDLAEEITRAHGAEALTLGDTGMILMRGSSRYSPGSAAGQALLAHELTHVAQMRPAAIARSAPEAGPLAQEPSEEEALAVEGQVAAEEGGAMSDHPSDQSAGKEDRKRRLVDKVMKLFEEAAWVNACRSAK
jgi:hypothetical protein